MLRKAKEAQNAAGKNVGMSGRDLVSFRILVVLFTASDLICVSSSNTIQNGSRRKKTMAQTIGILHNTDDRRSRKIWLQRRNALRIWQILTNTNTE